MQPDIIVYKRTALWRLCPYFRYTAWHAVLGHRCVSCVLYAKHAFLGLVYCPACVWFETPLPQNDIGAILHVCIILSLPASPAFFKVAHSAPWDIAPPQSVIPWYDHWNYQSVIPWGMVFFILVWYNDIIKNIGSFTGCISLIWHIRASRVVDVRPQTTRHDKQNTIHFGNKFYQIWHFWDKIDFSGQTTISDIWKNRSWQNLGYLTKKT